jgi:hypothetical protein
MNEHYKGQILRFHDETYTFHGYGVRFLQQKFHQLSVEIDVICSCMMFAIDRCTQQELINSQVSGKTEICTAGRKHLETVTSMKGDSRTTNSMARERTHYFSSKI